MYKVQKSSTIPETNHDGFLKQGSRRTNTRWSAKFDGGRVFLEVGKNGIDDDVFNLDNCT